MLHRLLVFQPCESVVLFDDAAQIHGIALHLLWRKNSTAGGALCLLEDVIQVDQAGPLGRRQSRWRCAESCLADSGLPSEDIH